MLAILGGLLVGIIFGFALQRGRFCMNSAIRDTILLKDNTLLKAVGIAVLVELFGFAILAMANLITISPKPLVIVGQLVGGFIFGIGMVLAGGCASGVTYRVGEGMIGSLSVVIGLAIGGSVPAFGFLKPLKDALQLGKISVGEASPTLANIVGLNHNLVAIVLALILGAIWYLVARNNKEDEASTEGSLSDRIFKKGWTWLPTGIVVGIIGIIAFWSSAAAGKNYPLRITSGWVTWVKLILPSQEASINWDAYLVLGIIIGALIAALIASEFKFRMPGWGVLGQTFVGGLLMGFGAVTGSGCNVTHILSGLPQLSVGSALAAVSIALGAWAASYIIFVRPNK